MPAAGDLADLQPLSLGKTDVRTIGNVFAVDFGEIRLVRIELQNDLGNLE
jgi:hypothetical protein